MEALRSAPGEAGEPLEKRGPLQRAAVLEEILRTIPPEVAVQVEEINK